MIWLFLYVFAISLYDLRTRRIPNWYTIPILMIGMLVNFPGTPGLWLASFILFAAWDGHWMGAGDVTLHPP
jgi:Flp pilus assembly protein protease CpaA